MDETSSEAADATDMASESRADFAEAELERDLEAFFFLICFSLCSFPCLPTSRAGACCAKHKHKLPHRKTAFACAERDRYKLTLQAARQEGRAGLSYGFNGCLFTRLEEIHKRLILTVTSFVGRIRTRIGALIIRRHGLRIPSG